MRTTNNAYRFIVMGMVANLLWMGGLDTYAGISVGNLVETGTIPVGATPRDVALAPDGSRLYVVNVGDVSSTTNRGSVSVIDTASRTVANTIQIGVGFPLDIAVTPDGNRAYLTVGKRNGTTDSTGSSRVEVIDLATETIVDTIPVVGHPWGPAVSAVTPDGTKVYVTLRGDQRVDVIDSTSNTIVASVPIGSGAQPIDVAITPDGSRAYVANRTLSTVTVIDTASDIVIATIPLTLIRSNGGAYVGISPDGTLAYATSTGNPDIAVIDTDPGSPTFNQQVDLISTTGSDLTKMAIISDGTLAFVVNRGNDEVLVIDTDTESLGFHTQVGAVQVGATPFDVVVQELGGVAAYVSNFGENTVSVIEDISTVGGALTGMSARTGVVICKNQTTRQTVLIRIPNGAESWDCEEAGLVVNPGDKVKMIMVVGGQAD